ncbi:MAG: erythromycin esterase family protein [bacterium]|nr:erythromycin esterase family protein [bacterium]
MKNCTIPLGVAVVLLGLALSPAALGDEISPGVYSLHGIQEDLPDDDLEPLQAIIGDASVVALGESIHGSGGYSRLKFRVFKYLVEHMGFRAFAFENPWGGTVYGNHYVQTCEGRDQAYWGLFLVWGNESVMDLFQWMCEWNQEHPNDRVHFFGFDIQQAYRDKPALLEFLDRIGVPPSDPWFQAIDSCTTGRTTPTESDLRTCVDALNEISDYYDAHEAEIIQITSGEDLEWARLHLLGLRVWQEQLFYLGRNSFRAFEIRDVAMAHAFEVIRELRYPGIKTVIWAHNTHIQDDALPSQGMRTMGTFLTEAFGDDYVKFALIGYDVGVDDGSGYFCGGPTSLHYDTSVEKILHDLGESYLFVDFAFPGATDPLLEPGRHYVISDHIGIPRDQFDGAFFLDHSPKMTPVAWPSCVPSSSQQSTSAKGGNR